MEEEEAGIEEEDIMEEIVDIEEVTVVEKLGEI